MKVLLTTVGSHGDVLPMIGLAREFKARGHDVHFFANETFARYATDVGLAFTAVGSEAEYLDLLRTTSRSDPSQAFKRVTEHLLSVARPGYEAMKRELRAGDTLVIGSSFSFAARLLHELDGVPNAVVDLSPLMYRSNIAPPRLAPRWIKASTPAFLKRFAWSALDRFFYDPILTAPLNRLRSEYGLAPLRHAVRDWLHDADMCVGLFPDWFAPPQPDWPPGIVLTGFPLYDHGAHHSLSPALEEFLDGGAPPVVFTAGTAAAAARDVFETSAVACARSGLRGVLVSQFPELIPHPLPAGVMHTAFAPFGALLPKVAAFVHHGGVGSTSQALAAGVPQIIRPVAFDQFDNAARVEQLGVGIEIAASRFKPRALEQVLSRAARDAALSAQCAALAQRVRSDGLSLACDAMLERLSKRSGTIVLRH